jgi:hypothetical protein
LQEGSLAMGLIPLNSSADRLRFQREAWHPHLLARGRISSLRWRQATAHRTQ